MVQHMRRHAERLANIFVVNATTPAQMFHALRRQLNRPFQKPLVLLTPKYLLHHRPATSALQDFTTGTFFNRVIDDGKVPPPPPPAPAPPPPSPSPPPPPPSAAAFCPFT